MSAAPAPASDEGSPGGYRAYVLGALLAAYTLNFLDRVLIGILQEPIRAEFSLTDLQLGILGGPAFALLYTLLGIPIARIAERANRVAIISAGLALWSAMTALCGFTTTYVQLLFARIGVGIGEAACTPPSHSILSDYFPPEKRATALAIYSLGVPLGTMLAALGGGWLAQNFDWRLAFVMLGLPGLLLALALKLTVREPMRAPAPASAYALTSVLKTLGRSATFWHIAIAGALVSFFGYGSGQFLPSFFLRNFQLSVLESSLVFAAIAGIAIAAGTIVGGAWGDRLARAHARAWVWIAGAGVVFAAPLYVAAFLQGAFPVSLALMLIAAFLQYLCLGPTYAVVQSIALPRMRATAAAFFLLITNLVGYGLGPPAIGALSDAFAQAPWLASLALCEASQNSCGPAAGLRVALAVSAIALAWAGAHYFWAGRTLERDRAAALV